MRNLMKVAVIALGGLGALSAAPASAQPYGAPYGPYDNGGYNNAYAGNGYDDDYGYCDQYGCPDDFYDQPLYYGQVYYDGDWFDGPIYYRDYYGRRQFWIHGGWRFTNQYRGGRFGPALGRGWYQQHRSEFANRGGYRGGNGGGYRNYGNYRDYSQRNFGGGNSFQPQAAQQPYNGGNAGGNDWRSRYSNRQGFGQNGFAQRGFQPQQAAPQAAPQVQQPQAFGGGRMNRGYYGGQGGGQRSFAPQAQPQAAPQPQPQAQSQGGGNRVRGGDEGRGGHRDFGGPPPARN